jgi:hypothetical protein
LKTPKNLDALDARLRNRGRPPKLFSVDCCVTRDEFARLDILSQQLGVSRWRDIRLAMHLLFEQERASADGAARPAVENRAGAA